MFQKLKFLFQILLVTSICSMAIYSLVQSLRHIFFSKTNTPPQIQPHAKPEFKRATLHWEKNKLILPHENFLPIEQQTQLKTNGTYFVLQSFENDLGEKKYLEKCYLGTFQLFFLNYDHFVFRTDKIYKNSKLETFANFNSKKLVFQILNKEQFLAEPLKSNCKSWTYIQNLSNAKFDKNKAAADNKISISIKKCISIPENKYMSMILYHSKTMRIEENPLTHKINLCALQRGFASVELQSLDGKISTVLIESKSIQKNQKIGLQDQFKKSFDSQLEQSRILPGWKNKSF